MKQKTADIMELCLHGKDSPCTIACPFSFDVRDMVDKIQRGSFGSAYSLYRNAVVFPDIVWRLCPAPCKKSCAQSIGTDSISLPMLERATIDYARSTDPINFNIAEKKARIAIVGAGLSGLACALKLASKRYQLTVYERSSFIGGSLENCLPRDVFESEIWKQFRFAACEFKMNTAVSSVSALEADVIYLSSGAEIDDCDDRTFRCPPHLHPIDALINGIRSAEDIEWFIQTGNKKPDSPEKPKQHTIFPKLPTEQMNAVLPDNGDNYSKIEVRQEASRCTQCDCSACMQQCVMLRQHGATPKDLAKEVGLSLHVFQETQGRAAMREIGSCMTCGLCEKICPVGIDIGDMMLKARIHLQEAGSLPPAHREFWLRDMAFADSEEASLYYAPDVSKISYLFFPGCQAGGSDPRYVSETYRRLLNQNSQTALLISCCGNPVLWAGLPQQFQNKLDHIHSVWKQAGEPVVILSCPSCYHLFATHLKDIPITTLYEVWDEESIPQNHLPESAIFDPCASRDFPKMQSAVRSLTKKIGMTLHELPYSGDVARCCSWSGQAYSVNRRFVKAQAREQIEQSELPYLVYCTNCRDIFASYGKNCRHILDLLLNINNEQRSSPTVSERRINRRNLKIELCSVYQIKTELLDIAPILKLNTSANINQKMNEELILEEDISTIISHCEQTKQYVIDQETGHRIGHKQIGYLTYWIEYAPNDDGSYDVYNAYSHRMSIKSESD